MGLTFDIGVPYGLAFSGGVDSSLLLAEMMRAGVDVKAYLVHTAFLASFEMDDARRVAEHLSAPLEVIELDILSHEDVCANPLNRCYLCKRTIFGTILEHMATEGRTVLCDGTNASDDPARRPGMRALVEMGVRSPLREAGLTKDLIRARARELGLPTATKPSYSCYATHVPDGCPITAASLAEAAAHPEAEVSRWIGEREGSR